MNTHYLTKCVFLNLILFIACIFLSNKALANERGCPSAEDKEGIEDRVIDWLFVKDSNSLTINRNLSEYSTVSISRHFGMKKRHNPFVVFSLTIDRYFFWLNGQKDRSSHDASELLTVSNEDPLAEVREAWRFRKNIDNFYSSYAPERECYIWSWQWGEHTVNYGVAIYNINDDLFYAQNKVYLCGIKHHLYRLGYLNAIKIPNEFLMTEDNIKNNKNYEIREDNFYFLTRLISSFGPKLNSGMTRVETKNSIKKYLKDLCFAN